MNPLWVCEIPTWYLEHYGFRKYKKRAQLKVIEKNYEQGGPWFIEVQIEMKEDGQKVVLGPEPRGVFPSSTLLAQLDIIAG